jgi:hypothetical protein
MSVSELLSLHAVTEIGTPKGGALYRYEEVMGFFRKMKLL